MSMNTTAEQLLRRALEAHDNRHNQECGSYKMQTAMENIRADLVDELVGALIDLEQWVSGTGYDKAKAALAKIKEET